MPDEADDAAHREEQARAEALGKRRPEAPPACGACLYCGEELAGARRWCDAACARDYEREQAALARNGFEQISRT